MYLWGQYTYWLVSNLRPGFSSSVSLIEYNYQLYIGARVRFVPFSASRDANLNIFFGESRRPDFATQSLRCALSRHY